MKKTYIIIAAILLLAACIAFPRNKDPETIAECWYCSELDFVLNVTPEKSELIWHDKQYEVIIGFRAGSGYDVFVENGDGIVSQEEILFRGTWTCKRGKLVLKINDDRLFEGAYNQLTFEPLASVGHGHIMNALWWPYKTDGRIIV